jgi:hypothetical protein
MAATRSFLIATGLLVIAVAAAAAFIIMRPGPDSLVPAMTLPIEARPSRRKPPLKRQ